MPKSKRGWEKATSYLIIIALILIFVSVLFAQHLYPNYSLSNNYISDLGVGSTATIFNTAMVSYGVLIMIAALSLFAGGRRRLTALGLFIVGLSGVGVGTFPETTGLPHIISALFAFGTLGVLALGYFRVYKGSLSYYSLVAGLLAILLLIVFGFALNGLHINTGIGHGAIEEIIYYDELAWSLVFAISLLKGRI